MSQILQVDGCRFDRATMLARQLEALCLLTSVAREDLDGLADGARDDLLSLTADLSRELCETVRGLATYRQHADNGRPAPPQPRSQAASTRQAEVQRA